MTGDSPNSLHKVNPHHHCNGGKNDPGFGLRFILFQMAKCESKLPIEYGHPLVLMDHSLIQLVHKKCGPWIGKAKFVGWSPDEHRLVTGLVRGGRSTCPNMESVRIPERNNQYLSSSAGNVLNRKCSINKKSYFRSMAQQAWLEAPNK